MYFDCEIPEGELSFDLFAVGSLLMEDHEFEAAEWVRVDKSRYATLIFEGPEVID